MIAHKFQKIHQVIGVRVIGIGLVGLVYSQQRKWNLAKKITTFSSYVGKAQLRQIKSLVNS